MLFCLLLFSLVSLSLCMLLFFVLPLFVVVCVVGIFAAVLLDVIVAVCC